MKKSLSKVRMRIRALRCGACAVFGLAAGAALCMALTAASFITPVEAIHLPLAALFFGCPLLGAVFGLIWPVPVAQAARRADACGLKERVRTALLFAGADSAMHRLQRADAETALAVLPVKQAMPFRPNVRALAVALALTLVAGVLLIVPNPQHDVLRARERERQDLRAQADEIEKAAAQLAQKALTPEELRELRKLTDEMTRALREAGDKREALSSLDDKQKDLERLREDIERRLTSETANALSSQPGLKGLSDAMEGGGAEALESALSEVAKMLESAEGAASFAEQVEAAAGALSEGDAKKALTESAAAARAGHAAQAAQALAGACHSAGATGANLNALMKMARSGAARSGTGGGSGVSQSPGQGAGGGAGRGTTQLDAGYKDGLTTKGNAGTGPAEMRVGDYERIYDPTRLGGDADPSFVEGQKGEGESQQMSLGPGQGELSGAVPYGQVIGEYREAAAQAVRRQALPETIAALVARYFDELIQ